MDIELKKLRYNIWFKVLAWMLCIGCALGAFAWSIQVRGNAYILTDYYDKYYNSSDFHQFLDEQTQNVFYAYGEPSEEDAATMYEVTSLETERDNLLLQIEERYSLLENITADILEQEEAEKQAVMDQYAVRIEQTKADVLERMKRDWDANREEYEKQITVPFLLLKDGELVKTNISGGDPVAIISEIPASQRGEVSYTGGWELTVAVPDEQYEEMAASYAAEKDGVLWALIGMCGCLAVGIAAFIWLMVLAGRRPVGETIAFSWFDRPFLDVSLVIIVIIFAMFIASFGYMFVWWNWLPWVAITILLNLSLYWLVCAAKRLKAHSFLKHTLIYWLWHKLWLAIQKTKLGWRIFWAVTGYVAFGVLTGIIAAVLLWSGHILGLLGGLCLIAAYIVATALALTRPIKNIKLLNSGLEKIQEGDLNYRIEGCKGRTFEEMAERINHMADGFRAAVGREVKSERMKSQLITNVSHDLKTPLTSIITYVDLLKQEELPEKAARYTEVLEQKAGRLKQLTDTLFEAAKASSGDITPTMKPIELRQFLEQVLGETSDQTADAGLTVIPDLGEKAVMVLADGALLWRVMGNLIGNACKYALKESRVYLSLTEKQEVEIEMKNISAQALNISADELMERFVRGDSARHSEGSGLGLSIAKSYVELMGGKFNIIIDGDLFKAVIRFPKYEKKA